ncbi:MAG: hypothetical protein NUW00_02600 [Candidatus Kaiserbacteria bacterium]|nr:hypothetical protein [Candidatus Kaiserbacteria bacterium]
MLGALFNNLGVRTEEAGLHANRMYAGLWVGILKILAIIIVLILLMVGINAMGGMSFNLLFFFGGIIPLVFFWLTPKMHVLAIVAGGFVRGMKDEDVTQGGQEGLNLLYSLLRGAVLWFWLMAGILSTIPIGQAPIAFFVFGAMMCIIGITTWHFRMPTKWAPRLIIGYAVVVSLMAGWQLVPTQTKEKVESYFTTQDTPRDARATNQTTKQEAKWERREADGSIPVGVWSQWIIVGGCNADFFLDEKHHARAKLTVGGVVSLTKDTHTNGVREISVMTEIKGETGYPIKFTCP